MDDLYTARAAIRQPATAGCGVVAHRMQPSFSLLWALVRHLPSLKLNCMWATAWQPALAGCSWWVLHDATCLATAPPSISTHPPRGSPSQALLRQLTQASAALDKTGAGAFMAWATAGLPLGGVANQSGMELCSTLRSCTHFTQSSNTLLTLR